MEIKGTITEVNLREALKRESLSVIKYKLYSEKAKEENDREASQLFDMLSNSKLEHVKLWNKCLSMIKKNKQNVEEAYQVEKEESDSLYMGYSATASSERFYELAELFKSVAVIENNHVIELKKLLDSLEK